MGFRDLAMFNDSLLAKQAWKLLQNKTSLFYRVFKVKFFPNCTIMEAKDSRSGSYSWRSILKGRDVIQRGLRWQVGDGRKIKIWQHHWLQIKHPTTLTSPIIETMDEAIVDILIDPHTRLWDESMVGGIFIPHEVELINKKIPLARISLDDVLCQPFSQDGQYNYKSGYPFMKVQKRV